MESTTDCNVIVRGRSGAAVPARFWRPGDSVDRGFSASVAASSVSWISMTDLYTFSMRMAVALNSAVPDFGSQASMVRC